MTCTYRVGSIVVEDDGRNVRISKSHSPSEEIVIESADLGDLMAALMAAEDCRVDLADDTNVAVSPWRRNDPGRSAP